MHIIEGNFDASGHKFALVASRFNELIVSKLIEGAKDCLLRHGATASNLTLVWVPGAFEIPLAVGNLVDSGQFDAVIALGAVIRGSTPHFDYVAGEVSKGIAQESLRSKVPVMFGVLTTDTLEQAFERAGTKAGNKGWEAALGAIEMANLKKAFAAL